MNDEEQIVELVKTLHHTRDRRIYERYQVILLYLEEYRLKKITIIIHRSSNTVVNYRKCMKVAERSRDGYEYGDLRHHSVA